MATLANLVKNIDPPVEITQEEYNNLTEEQKNDGTVYYIVDGSSSFQTAATTPAEASDGTGSNVQVELDKRLEISKLVNGGTATEEGYALDARYGKTLTDQINALNNEFTDQYSLSSTSGHQVSGQYSRIGNFMSIRGRFKATSTTTDNVALNCPAIAGTIGVVGRDSINGNLILMWMQGQTLSTYLHTGTITIGNDIAFTIVTPIM